MRSRLEETDRKLLETSMNARAMEGEHETLTNTLQNQEDEIVELKTKISDLKSKGCKCSNEVSQFSQIKI